MSCFHSIASFNIKNSFACLSLSASSTVLPLLFLWYSFFISKFKMSLPYFSITNFCNQTANNASIAWCLSLISLDFGKSILLLSWLVNPAFTAYICVSSSSNLSFRIFLTCLIICLVSTSCLAINLSLSSSENSVFIKLKNFLSDIIPLAFNDCHHLIIIPFLSWEIISSGNFSPDFSIFFIVFTKTLLSTLSSFTYLCGSMWSTL